MVKQVDTRDKYMLTEKQRLKLLALYPGFVTVHGPYKRKDSRYHVVLCSVNSKKKKTVSYPKAIVEIRRGSRLERNETVDHINGNFLDNSRKNLQVISREANASKGADKRKPVKCKCAWCNAEFELSAGQVNARAKTKAGPFCSRSCSGRYGAQVQNTGVTLKRKTYKVRYIKGV